MPKDAALRKSNKKQIPWGNRLVGPPERRGPCKYGVEAKAKAKKKGIRRFQLEL